MQKKTFTADAFFAGVGGIELGFKETGRVKVQYANEFDQQAGVTYKLNNPDVNFDDRDIHKVKATEIPDCDIMMGGFPCFTSSALVATKDGLKNINQVAKGELVLTREGNFKSVTKTMQKEADALYNLKVEGKIPVNVTANHPILTRHKTKKWSSETKKSVTIISEPEWTEVADLEKGDLVLINSYQEDSSIKVNNTDLWLFGCYLSRSYYDETNKEQSIFYVDSEQAKEFEKHLTGYDYTKSEMPDNPDCLIYKINSQFLLELVSQVKQDKREKEIPTFIFQLSIKQRQILIDGICFGQLNETKKNYEYIAFSEKLATSFANLIELTLHKDVSISEKRGIYKLQWAKELNSRTHSYVLDGQFWKPIKSIKKLDECDTVYNLEVADSHTYVVNGFCVHNCQAFSVSGYQKGFDDPRGTLFFEMLRLIKAKRPRAVFCENVKNLVTHDHNNTFRVIREALVKNNYFVKWKVLNSKDYGNIPQNRERIYIVAFKNKADFDRFSFPKPIKLTTSLRDIIAYDKDADDKYYYNQDNFAGYKILDHDAKNANHVYQWRRVYVRENKSGVVPTLTASMGTGGNNVPIIITDDGRYRKLTPKECFNVQGYPKDFKLPDISNSQLYKQAGNSVVVPVIRRIATNIIKAIDYPDPHEVYHNQKYVLIYNKMQTKYDGESYIIETSDAQKFLIKPELNIIDSDSYSKIMKKNKPAEFFLLERS